ncbi:MULTISPECIES: hypothetical protein [Sorangium]|uniref:hypothetical protein n=1 Tax=Sorangium TaxID=39643 RepID=UPI003D9C274B
MSLFGLLSQLGSALVSLGLGGPGDSDHDAIPCPEVHAAADAHTVVQVSAESHTVVQATADC